MCPSFSGASSEVQLVAAHNLADDVLGFIRSDRGFASATLAGGRARLADQLLELSDTFVGQDFSSPAHTKALQVDPVRVAPPKSAGSIDPAGVLPEPYLSCFKNWERDVRLHESDWPSPLPRSCHVVPRHRELSFIKSFLARDMGRLWGREASGFFCVAHKARKDRLINDKRGANETERPSVRSNGLVTFGASVRASLLGQGRDSPGLC